jgi:hypothetical protein
MKIAYVLSEGATASTDYFLFPYLKANGYLPKLLDVSVTPTVPLHTANSLLVIARYLPSAWCMTVSEMKVRGIRVAYFMDDDLFDLRALRSLPWRYRWKILKYALTQKTFLRTLCDEFWVSTTYLADKYAELRPVLISAEPPARLIIRPERQLHICYHATASHRREISWLAAVVQHVQSCADNTHFELFAGAEARRHYRGIPRVSMLFPMKWPAYLDWSGSMRRDIALAPLLPSAFNRGRGPTKFYDYSRLGAAGIYTNVSPYRGFIRDGVDGLLLGNDPKEWAAAILALAADETRRTRIAAAARSRALGGVGGEARLVSG